MLYIGPLTFLFVLERDKSLLFTFVLKPFFFQCFIQTLINISPYLEHFSIKGISLFQLYGSKARSFEESLFWVGQYDLPHPQPSYWEKN